MRQSRQRGFSYLEISFSLILLGLLGFYALTAAIEESKRNLARLEAGQMLRVAEALQAYAELYRDQLPANSATITRRDQGGTFSFMQFAPTAAAPEGSKLSPTIAQLVSLGFLPTGTLNQPYTSRGTFITRLTLHPSIADCRARPSNCQIHGYVALNSPVTSTNDPTATPVMDPDLLGYLFDALGSEGFVTFEVTNDAVAVNGNFTQQLDLNGDGQGNPLPFAADTLPAGLAGVRVAALVNQRLPVAGIDFCPRTTDLYAWTANGSASVNNTPPLTQCAGRLDTDVSAGLSANVFDLTRGLPTDPPGSNPQGYAVLRCERQADGQVLLVAQTGAVCG